VGVAGWVTGPDLPERVELVRAALPDADRARFEQDLVQALKIARSTRDLAPLGQVVEGWWGVLFVRAWRWAVKHVTVTDDGVELRLGEEPIIVPMAFGDLLEELFEQRRGATATGPEDSVWLYPAPRLGQPLAPRVLLQRLRALGVPPTVGRNTALMEMAGEMPAAVITRLLGISLHRATRWTRDAGNTRPGYAAALSQRNKSRYTC
jgi:hypothetical protein